MILEEKDIASYVDGLDTKSLARLLVDSMGSWQKVADVAYAMIDELPPDYIR